MESVGDESEIRRLEERDAASLEDASEEDGEREEKQHPLREKNEMVGQVGMSGSLRRQPSDAKSPVSRPRSAKVPPVPEVQEQAARVSRSGRTGTGYTETTDAELAERVAEARRLRQPVVASESPVPSWLRRRSSEEEPGPAPRTAFKLFEIISWTDVEPGQGSRVAQRVQKTGPIVDIEASAWPTRYIVKNQATGAFYRKVAGDLVLVQGKAVTA